MNYVSFQKLREDVRRFAARLPDLGMVIGIPRSGMLVASLIALERNWFLGSIKNEGGGIAHLGYGRRYNRSSVPSGGLVVDDSFHEGATMAMIRERMHSSGNFQYAAMYVSDRGAETLDWWHEIVPAPRLFAWNWQHHSIVSQALVDMDGLLCEDPLVAEVHDESAYRNFLSEAKPLWRPSGPIGGIVTARLDKWRIETERWLVKHGVQSAGLHMLTGATAHERLSLDLHWRHKSAVYAACDWAQILIESCPDQSEKIAKATNRSVLCPTNDVCYLP